MKFMQKYILRITPILMVIPIVSTIIFQIKAKSSQIFMPNLVWPLAIATMIFTPVESKAVNYAFIKMACNPDENTVSIKAFFDQNASAEERIKHPQKGTYYLNDIAYKEEKCDLGGGHMISFIAHQSDEHPKDNDLTLYIDRPQYGSPAPYTIEDLTIPLDSGNWDMYINVSTNGYIIRYCPEFSFSYLFDKDKVHAKKRHPACEILNITHKTFSSKLDKN